MTSFLADIPKGRDEVIRVTREMSGGHDLIQLRIWFTKDGELRPSKAGLPIDPHRTEAVIAAIQAARQSGGNEK